MILRNSNFTNNYAYDYGGAIYYNGNVNGTVENCIFEGNSVTDNDGGAIYYNYFLNVRDSVFIKNKARENGGAIYVKEGTGRDKSLGTTIENSRFEGNVVKDASVYQCEYGAPPHCGVGIGLERLVMILCDTDNIKDVVAFPKTASAYCLMADAPNVVDQDQLDFLSISINKGEDK